MIQKIKNFNLWIIILCIVFFILGKCSSPEPVKAITVSDTLTPLIKASHKKIAELKKHIAQSDSMYNVFQSFTPLVVERWHKAKTIVDSTIPQQYKTVLNNLYAARNFGDSINELKITHLLNTNDTLRLLTVQLENLNRLDSMVYSSHQTLSHDTICQLKKEVKKQKNQKRFFAALLAADVSARGAQQIKP